jgi:hypothetical protein
VARADKERRTADAGAPMMAGRSAAGSEQMTNATCSHTRLS